MKIAIGNDHAGTQLKIQLKSFLEEYGYEIINFGSDSIESVDYPNYVHPVVNSIRLKEIDLGILFVAVHKELQSPQINIKI
jgi:ribose 5-phosphate isomerase B